MCINLISLFPPVLLGSVVLDREEVARVRRRSMLGTLMSRERKSPSLLSFLAVSGLPLLRPLRASQCPRCLCQSFSALGFRTRTQLLAFQVGLTLCSRLPSG